MKKALVVFSLVLVIAVSIVAGTLAMYTTTIDTLAQGSVVAKEFILLEDGSDTFTNDVKIAPAETQNWQFAVKNFDGAKITETKMKLDVTINLAAISGKNEIAPLTVTVKNSNGDTVAALDSTHKTVTFQDEFPIAAAGQSKSYTVAVNWPSNNAVDYSYAGANFGSAVTVSVTGTQVA
ncbi:MAG: hypothetical protein Q8878_03140 [Bacillota bacterium]|nr:hypothetical protein [Bacillota bacterium]